MQMTKKVCKTCDCEKDLGEFWKHSETKDGYRPSCKSCIKQQSSKHYIQNFDKYKERLKKWKSENKDKMDAINAKHRRSDRRKETLEVWRDKNREDINKYQRQWKNNKYKNDNSYRLNMNISRAIRLSLNGKKKGHKWVSLVNFTLDSLIKHLESQFKPGMTWENYGEWHIDHIIPISYFNITDFNCEDFKKCWSLNNLQPLWAKDNLTKGNRFIG